MLFQPGEIEEFWLPFCFCGFGFAFCWLSVGFLGKNRSFLEQEAERIRQLNALSTRWDRGFLGFRFAFVAFISLWWLSSLFGMSFHSLSGEFAG